ncbi:MAG: hypothetical protein CFE44_00375 [Burkholderiales bacterium PBB4]|nr:MAG: hypothetical protein CFE44_00375 [Burkholderiales bacterium PBB4]
MAIKFNDPLFKSQWYLVNTGQRGGDSRLDLNILSAWEKYTGKGIIVAVNDDGLDLTHPSMVANLLTNLAYDAGRDLTGQGFANVENSHGTVVGSIVGMAANDGIGGVGVAFDAKIVPNTNNGDNAKLFLANLSAGASVSVNSWGSDPSFSANFGASGSQADQAWGAALTRAATEARGGLGMVIEVSGGNERGTKADVAMTSWNNSKLVISVGAITETGAPTDYSSAGGSLLVTAFGGVSNGPTSQDQGFGVPSADIQGTAGYNTTAGTDGDYAFQNQGTSYSGPMVGGAAALMLQANPKLGFRDVSTILALTARKVDASNASWVQTHATDWNLGGMHFSRDFGYGLVDVSAAVRLAESWSLPAGTMANWKSAEGVSATASGAIPDNSTAGFTASANVTSNVRIERVEFDLNLTATSPSQLSATITSPSGTTVGLFDQPLSRPLKSGAPDLSQPESAWPATFTVGSTAFLGESSAGTWTLKLVDKVTGVEASYNSLTVRAWGSDISTDNQYVLTDEFASTTLVINDAEGTDTVNAAALATAVKLNLTAGQQSQVGSGTFTISSTSTLENAIGGLGDDTLTGNGANNLLRGNGGSDALDGGAGIDTAIYTSARAGYTLAVAATTKVTDKAGFEGVDTLSGIERLQFSDSKVAIDLTPGGNAAKTAQLLGVVGYSFLTQKATVGTVLGVVDQTGADLKGLFGLLVSSGLTTQLAGGDSNEALVKLVFRNVTGTEASDAQASALASQLLAGSGGALSKADFLTAAANLELNLQHIGLVGTGGLFLTGLEYI